MSLVIDKVHAPHRLPVITWRDVALMLGFVCVTLMVWYVDNSVTRLNEETRVKGLKNRAAICDFVKEFGGALPGTCKDPELLPYLDPAITPGSGERKNTTVLLCRLLEDLHDLPVQCSG